MRPWLPSLLGALALAPGCGGEPEAELACGAGTVEADGVCAPASPLSCGEGTHEREGACVPDSSLACGAGTQELDGACVPFEGSPCGAGTRSVDGRCVPTAPPTFELRVAVQTIPADGLSLLPVLVLGRGADGNPSTETLVLGLSRPDAGRVSPSRVQLGPLGAQLEFTPCRADEAGCLGPVQLTAALASAPETIVATSEPIELVAPTGVGSTAPCLGGGSALFFDGESWVFHGVQTVTEAIWAPTVGPDGTVVSLHVEPEDRAQGLWWVVDLSSARLGEPLRAPQLYEEAQRFPFEAPGHPGLDVGGDGRGCNEVSGRFELHTLRITEGVVDELLVTFEHRCEERELLRGCARYVR